MFRHITVPNNTKNTYTASFEWLVFGMDTATI